MRDTAFGGSDGSNRSDGQGEAESGKPTQPTRLYAEPRADAAEALPPAHPPTPISQRAVIPTPVDRGRTQPADPVAPNRANQAGYGGRYPVPAQVGNGDAETIRTEQPQPHPQLPPTEATLFRPLPPGADVPAFMAPTSAPTGVTTPHTPTYSPSHMSASADRPAPYLTVPPERTRRSRAGLVFAGSVALLALLLAGAGFLAFSYLPTGPMRAFCADLTAQHYSDAYALTDQRFQSLYSQQQFTQDMTTLDLAEGTATVCQSAVPLAFTAVPLGSSQFSARITRQAHGARRNFPGDLTVAYHDGWQIDALATSLLGVNFGALDAIDGYCAALRSQNYQRAYQLLGTTAQTSVTANAYTTTERLHDLISGTITSCGVVAVGQKNTDTQANLTLGVTRRVAGAIQGNVTLTFTASVWTLGAIATRAEGPDVGPYLVGQQFCADLAANRFDEAYNLFTPLYQAANPRAQFVSAFESGRSQGISYSCDTPDFTTYRVTGDSASYVVPFVETLDGIAIPANDTLSFALQSNGQWLISNSDVQSPF